MRKELHRLLLVQAEHVVIGHASERHLLRQLPRRRRCGHHGFLPNETRQYKIIRKTRNFLCKAVPDATCLPLDLGPSLPDLGRARPHERRYTPYFFHPTAKSEHSKLLTSSNSEHKEGQKATYSISPRGNECAPRAHPRNVHTAPHRHAASCGYVTTTHGDRRRHVRRHGHS